MARGPRLRKSEAAARAWARMLAVFLAHRERMAGILGELGISFGDMKGLLALEPDDPRPMRSLAETWACDASNATWMVDRLEERGLVERRVLPSDRRVKAVVLTPEGLRLKHELLERIHEPPAELATLTVAELEALGAALARLAPDDQPSTLT